MCCPPRRRPARRRAGGGRGGVHGGCRRERPSETIRSRETRRRAGRRSARHPRRPPAERRGGAWSWPDSFGSPLPSRLSGVVDVVRRGPSSGRGGCRSLFRPCPSVVDGCREQCDLEDAHEAYSFSTPFLSVSDECHVADTSAWPVPSAVGRPGSTGLTETRGMPRSRTLLSTPCNAAWSTTGPVMSVSPPSTVIARPSNQSAHREPS